MTPKLRCLQPYNSFRKRERITHARTGARFKNTLKQRKPMRPKTQLCKFAYRLYDQSMVEITMTMFFVIDQSLQRKRSTQKKGYAKYYLNLQKLIQPLPRRREQKTTLSTGRTETCRFQHEKRIQSIRHPLMSNSHQSAKADTIASERKRTKVIIS